MNSDKKLLFTAILLSGLIVNSCWSNRWVPEDPAVVLRQEPLQQQTRKQSFLHKGFTVTPVASFQIKARVLGKERYYWGKESKLAPIDLALGWGPMAQDQILGKLRISQSNRWYRYRYKIPPIPPEEITNHSANMHIIPADHAVARKLRQARRGESVSLRGYLVNVSDASGWYWNSSQSRTDSGRGACEIVWVQELEIL